MSMVMAYKYQKVGVEGTHKRDVFKKRLAEDLGKASLYPPNLFNIVEISEGTGGTTTAEVEILPNKAKDRGTPQHIAEDIALQVRRVHCPFKPLSGRNLIGAWARSWHSRPKATKRRGQLVNTHSRFSQRVRSLAR